MVYRIGSLALIFAVVPCVALVFGVSACAHTRTIVMIAPSDKTWADRINDSRECTGLAQQRKNEPITKREIQQRIPVVLKGNQKYYTKNFAEYVLNNKRRI